jgi:hypothetical protein
MFVFVVLNKNTLLNIIIVCIISKMLLARSAARLRVAEYFDELVSQLDTRAEQLLVDPDNDDRSINAFRISIIDKIRDIEALNFRRIDDEPTDESPLLRPFCFVVFNKDFEFLTDLELVDGNFAYLVIPEACLTAENVVNYKNLLGFYNNYDGIDFSKLFKIKHQVKHLFFFFHFWGWSYCTGFFFTAVNK